MSLSPQAVFAFLRFLGISFSPCHLVCQTQPLSNYNQSQFTPKKCNIFINFTTKDATEKLQNFVRKKTQFCSQISAKNCSQ
jgi:hypothetical protein